MPLISAGITRQGAPGDWPRRLRVAVLGLTMALGFTRAVRATERAADSYWHQEISKSLASRARSCATKNDWRVSIARKRSRPAGMTAHRNGRARRLSAPCTHRKC